MIQRETNIDASEHDLLVFEERHKGYGAFVIRSQYHKQLLRGFIFGISVILFILLLQWVFALLNHQNRMTIAVNLSDAPGTFMQIPEPPSVEQKSSSIQPHKDLVVPEIKSQARSDTSTAANNNQSSTSPGTSNGNSTNGNGENGNGFVKYDTEPSFPGGREKLKAYIDQNIDNYYKAKDKTRGTVIIGFLVSKNGDLTEIHVVKSLSPALDKASLEVIKSMSEGLWIPGLQSGKPVDKVPAQISIEFTL